MPNQAAAGSDLAEDISRWIAVVRDGLLVGLLGFGLYILYHLWPQIGAELKTATIESVSFGDVLSVKLNNEAVSSFQTTGLTLDAVGGWADILEKGTPQDLSRAELMPGGRFDMVGVSAGQTYGGDLLIAYISRLAPQFVIFRNAQKLEAWVDAGTLAVQLSPHTSYSYVALMHLHGLHIESIGQSASARDALEKMQSLHIDHLPVVDNEGHFRFMLSREDILSKIVTAALLDRKPAKSE